MRIQHSRSRVIVRAVVAGLVLSLLLVSSLQASVVPRSNRIINRDFETGPGHFSPWFRDGNAQIIGDESCCGQHETFFWPDGAAHGRSSLPDMNTNGNSIPDTWDGFIYNQNQAGTQYGALAQNPPNVTANQKYRLSAWMASSNGNTAFLRWYANGVTNSCAQTNGIWPGSHVIWPTSLNVSCEFTPNNVSGFNVQMAANVSRGQWVLSDDWALTPLFITPIYPGARLPRSIRYWARDYGNSVDRAANSWNAATGKTLFVKASSEADAKLVIDGVDTFCNPFLPNGDEGFYAATYDVNEQRAPQCNIGVDRELIELNMWYFSRWSGDPKQSTITHELGHALGLFEIDTYDPSHESCQVMTSDTAKRYYHCGVIQPTSGDANSVPYP